MENNKLKVGDTSTFTTKRTNEEVDELYDIICKDAQHGSEYAKGVTECIRWFKNQRFDILNHKYKKKL